MRIITTRFPYYHTPKNLWRPFIVYFLQGAAVGRRLTRRQGRAHPREEHATELGLGVGGVGAAAWVVAEEGIVRALEGSSGRGTHRSKNTDR